MHTRSNKRARKNRHQKLFAMAFVKKATDGSILTSLGHLCNKAFHTAGEVFFHSKMRYHTTTLTLLLFISSACIFPNFVSQNFAHGSYSDGDGDGMIIPLEENNIDELIKNADLVNADGVLNNTSFSIATETHMIEYQVTEGDTVSTIAEAFGISMQTVLSANNLKKTDHLKIGQTLKILPVNGIIHQTSVDVSLADLAKQYGVEESLIADHNTLTTDSIFKKGTSIIIPGVTEDIPAATQMIAVSKTDTPPANTSKSDVHVKKIDTKTPLTTKKDIPTVVTAKGSKMVWPTANPVITTRFSSGHPGIDICYTQGDHTTGIAAAMGGKVIQAQGGWNGGYGNMVVIDHGNGIQTRYAHMREIYVSVGQQVKAGQAVGWMGRTGNVHGITGLHLHFEVIVNKKKVNPYTYL